jgi:hypothetical protein
MKMLLLLGALFAGKLWSYEVDHHFDQFNGITTTSIRDAATLDPEQFKNCDQGSQTGIYCPIFLDMSFTTHPGHKDLYLIAKYGGDSWLFLDSLVVLADGKKFSFNQFGRPDHNVENYGGVSENIIFKLSKQQAHAIFSANSVLMKFQGSKGSSVRCLPNDWLQAFRKFLHDEYGLSDLTFAMPAPTPSPASGAQKPRP